MGIVIAATHLHLHQRVALKFMLASKSGAQGYHDRFLREARAASMLKNEHVTRVFEFGYLENDAPFMVMEYLEGQDLAAVLAERGPLPIPEAVDYILQTCEAVGEAHAVGIIHRDLKPANLFLCRPPGKAPSVKVIDFGISKFKDKDEESALTKTGTAMGSPLYMSPEQMKESKDVDGRADIWSLSVTLYELLAGSGNTPFFTEGGLPKLCLRVYMDAPTPLGTHRPDAPSGLQAVLFQALEKDRDRRFANIAEFAAALAPFGSPRAGAYVERVAEALGSAIAPARPTALLPVDPSAPPAPSSLATYGTGDAAVAGSAPANLATPRAMTGGATTGGALSRPAAAPAQRRGGSVVAGVGVGIVLVALAVVGVWRWRVGSGAPVAAASATADIVAPAATEPRDAAPPSASPTLSRPPDQPTVTPAPGGTAPAPATSPAKIEAPRVPTTRGAAAQHAPLTKTPPRPATPTTNVYER
jgi:serine/threonine-protein kinase